MNTDSEKIIKAALADAMPGAAVCQALDEINFGSGKLVMVAAGKAAWEMASAAAGRLGDRIDAGIVITKYDHAKGDIPNTEIREAGHPVPDENSYSATARALELVQDLSPEDSVLFLLSGGGSALFEQPLIPADEMAGITKQLLACGADIVEINTIRKRLSAVKGGRFALCCAPAHVYTVVLSDIIGDPLDMIASGPAYPDSSTCEKSIEIVERYGLKLSPKAEILIRTETPKTLDNVTTYVTGSVKQLCRSAERVCKELGYEPVFLTSSLNGEAREVGTFLGAIARDHQASEKSLAFLAGGETVVHLTGKGKGGRNQEIALSAAKEISGCRDTCVFSFGSDGTDGPTDAAGGFADEHTLEKLTAAGLDVRAVLSDNDAYNALKAVEGLIVTGPTGTNVNDLAVVLIKR
ncbi:MAG: glycerate kinase [Clostridiales bacterium]|nr:glycerate kinase [Clostridiales bacterium]